MTDHPHDQRGHHRDHETHAPRDDEPTGAWFSALHRDWRFWVAVVLALVAMALYVMSMDEALQPGGDVEEPMPAAASG